MRSRKYQQSPAAAPKTRWSDMASVPNRLRSNKVISKVSYPQGLPFRPNKSRYLFLQVDGIKVRLQFYRFATEQVYLFLVVEK